MARGITVDSGAADLVMPRRMVRGRGNKIQSSQASKATANRIRNEGETDLSFDTEDGKKLNWTCQIAEVNKVLASVSYLVDHNSPSFRYPQGYQFHHEQDRRRGDTDEKG